MIKDEDTLLIQGSTTGQTHSYQNLIRESFDKSWRQVSGSMRWHFTVARQPVNCTRFPFKHSSLYAYYAPWWLCKRTYISKV